MLQEKYKKEIIGKMKEEFGYKSVSAVPKIEKTVINVGIGRFLKDEKTQEYIANTLAIITGQKPIYTLSKKAISAFKIRDGLPIGLKVTLRKGMMFDFLDRLINVVLPRTKDFRGIPEKSVDQNGNLNIGIKEHIIFPEMAEEDIRMIFGMEITVVSTTHDRTKALELFKLLGFPIQSAK